MEVSTDKAHEITARKLMEIMLYDNGAVNALEPDSSKRYPEKHLNAIATACEGYFDVHPELLTNDNLDEMATGEYNENQEKFGKHPEYAALDKALNDFFDMI